MLEKMIEEGKKKQTTKEYLQQFTTYNRTNYA